MFNFANLLVVFLFTTRWRHFHFHHRDFRSSLFMCSHFELTLYLAQNTTETTTVNPAGLCSGAHLNTVMSTVFSDTMTFIGYFLLVVCYLGKYTSINLPHYCFSVLLLHTSHCVTTLFLQNVELRTYLNNQMKWLLQKEDMLHSTANTLLMIRIHTYSGTNKS